MDNPYQIVGTYDGGTYIERSADILLRRAIETNQSYPYFCSPRQSGKSSLIAHTVNNLNSTRYSCLLVDLSEIFGDYSKHKSADDLLLSMAQYIALKIGFPVDDINVDFIEDTFVKWLSNSSAQLVIFLDELDALIEANYVINTNFSADFLQRLRGLFNKRSDNKYRDQLCKLQFILAGSAHPLRLAPDRARSPFNIGDNIPLLDLTRDQIYTLAGHLQRSDICLNSQVIDYIFKQTSGNMYLTRLIFRDVWESFSMHDQPQLALTLRQVQGIVDKICLDSVNNIHFLDIYRRIKNNARLSKILAAYYNDGKLSDQDDLNELILTGICSETKPFRCLIYKNVFDRGGPLRLVTRSPNRMAWVVGLSVFVGVTFVAHSLKFTAASKRTIDIDAFRTQSPIDMAAATLSDMSVPIDASYVENSTKILDLGPPDSFRPIKPRMSRQFVITGADREQLRAINFCVDRELKPLLPRLPVPTTIQLERAGSLHVVQAPKSVFSSEFEYCLRQLFTNLVAPEKAIIHITFKEQ